jgi:predicted membrane protein DUF2254
MKERLVLLLRRSIYEMRGGFLVRPLVIALVLGCAGALLSWAEETVPALSSWLPAVLFPSHADPQVAQVILAGIAGSIMTVVSIVFAILLMTLTLASMQFSPRIMLSFTRDRVTQWTLGIFLGSKRSTTDMCAELGRQHVWRRIAASAIARFGTSALVWDTELPGTLPRPPPMIQSPIDAHRARARAWGVTPHL